MLDYLIVGCGLYGATFARSVTNAGKKCLIIDKRNHIGGNTYTKKQSGIDVHMYGPHIFHTNSPKIWNYVNQFSEFNSYRHRVKCQSGDSLYSFPLNLNTLEEMWGPMGDGQLLEKLELQKAPHQPKENLEDWAIAEVGEDIYRKFIYGYTKKQWGKEPRDLPSFIIKRIPIRKNRDNDYHECKFSGIPVDGYTKLIRNIIDGIPCELGVDYLDRRDYWDSLARHVVYTGPIDDFFNHEYGTLEWRSLKFEHNIHDSEQRQPVAQINYPEDNVKFTRTVEHKHFNPTKTKKTVITTEYPQEYKKGREKFYPINDKRNNLLYEKYSLSINTTKYVLGGRLARYKYYDMDQVIAASLKKSKNRLENST